MLIGLIVSSGRIEYQLLISLNNRTINERVVVDKIKGSLVDYDDNQN